MSNKKLLKNLLATASMVAVLAGGATNAAASLVYTATASPSHTSNAAGEIHDEGGGNSALVDNKILSTNGANRVIFDQDGRITSLWITDNGLNHEVNDNTTFNAIAGANASTFVVAASETMTLGSGVAFTDAENDGNGVIAANTFTMLGDVTLGDGATLDVGANIACAAVNVTGKGGNLVLANGSQIGGNVGAANNALASVEVTGAAGNMGVLHTKALSLKGNASAIEFAGGSVGAITTDTDTEGTVTSTADTTFDTVGAEGKALDTLALQGAVVHTLNGDVYATNVTANNANTALLLGAAVTINGTVDGAGGNFGIVRMKNTGNNTITGNVGANQAIANILFDGGTGTLNIAGTNVRSVAITGSANNGTGNILNLTNKAAVALTAASPDAAGTKNLSINFSSEDVVTLSGNIGGANNPLKALSAASASKVIFAAGDRYITELNAKNVELAAATYMFGSVTKDVTMKLTGDAVFATKTNLDGFKSIDLNGGNTATFTDMNLTGGSIIGNGNLIFGGTSSYNTTATGALTDVTVDAAGKFTLAKGLESTDFVIGDAARATINAPLKANVSRVANAGNLGLVLGEGSSITGNVDLGDPANTITVEEGVSTEITGALANAAVTLGGKGASLKVTGAAANTALFATAGDNVDALILGADHTAAANTNIGANNAGFKSITLTADTTIRVQGNAAIYATNLYNSADKQGNVTFGALANTPIFNIGTANSRFNVVTLGAASTLKGDIYALALTRGANALTIEDGNSIVVTNSTGAGDITFNGNGAFSGTFGVAGGRVAHLTFADAKSTVKGAGTVYATDIAHDGELMLTGNLRLDSANAATFADGATINASSYTATYTNAAIAANTTVNLKVALTDSAKGSVVANALTFGADAKLSLTVEDTRKVSNVRNSNVVKVIDFTAPDAATATRIEGELNSIDIEEAGSSRFLSAGTLDVLKNTVSHNVTASINAEVDLHVAEDMKRLNGSESVQRFAQALDTSNGEFDTVLDSIDTLSDKDYVNSLERFTNSSSDVVSNTGLNVVTDSMNQVSTRSSAVAAGDAGVEVGAWVEGIVGQGEQKIRKGQAGFKSNASGVTVGVDTELNDASIIGVAATMVNTDVKMKDYLDGDKSKIQSYMASVYGSYNFAGNFMLQGSASFGNNTVKNTNKRILNTGAVNANSKFDGTAFGVKATLGYDYKISDIASVTPMTGLEYARFDAGNATETGAGAQNRKVQVKATDKLTGILGAKVKANIDLGSDMMVTPEMHVIGGYDFKGNKAKSVVKLATNDANIPVSTVKAARTSFNVGGSITTKYDNMEYGIGYDAKISDKYFGQQGSLKVRVNF